MKVRRTYLVSPPPRGGGAAFVLLLLVMVWAPLPLGSNRDWSSAVLWLALLGLTALLLLSNLDRTGTLWERLSPGRWPLLGLALWCLVALLQLWPLPEALVSALSPAAHLHWTHSGVPAPWPLSLDPGATVADALQSLALLALLALVLLSAASWQRLTALALVVAGMGALQALLGIHTHIAAGHGLLPGAPVEGVGGISGTYVNPNHYAGMLELGIAVVLGLTLLGGDDAAPVTGRFARLADGLMSARVALLLPLVLMLTAMFWSGSRGGLLAIGIAGTTALAIATLRRGRGLHLLLWLPLAMGLSLLWMGPGTLHDKLDAQGLSGNRGELYAASLTAAMDYPLLGAGAGGYRHVLPAYKVDRLDLRFYEHAHNDLIEELVERGVVGAGALMLAVVAALVQIATALRRRRGRLPRALLAGALAGVLALSVHGMVDFNLQIPANAVYFIALMGLGLAAGSLERARTAPVSGS